MQGIGVVEETESIVPSFGIEPEEETSVEFAQKVARLEAIDAQKQKADQTRRAGQLDQIEAQRQDTMQNSIAMQMFGKMITLPESVVTGKDAPKDTTATTEQQPTE
jgi:hypothetical protein